MIKKMKKTVLSVVTAATLSLSFTTTTPADAATSYGPEMKSVLMYAGKFNSTTTYNQYTDADLTNLMKGANTFIILSAFASNPDDTDHKEKVNLIRKIVAKNSGAKIWISTLHRGANSNDFTADKLTTELNQFQADLGSTIWKNNIEGIYVNIEHVYKDTADPKGTDETVYTGDYWNKLNNSMNSNVTVKLFKALDSWATSNGKKKLGWAPYVDTDTDILRRVAWVANQTSLFDIILLQPNWYFHGDIQNGKVLNKPNYLLKVVERSMNNGALSYTDGSYILPQAYVNKRVGNIGVDMEFDERLANNSVKYNRLIEYELTFKEKLQSGKYPFTFYMGSTGIDNNRYLDKKTPFNKYTWEYMVDYYSNGTVHPKQ
ncbi:hypothetical protein [Bacillus sp. F9_6S_D1_P_5]